MRGLAGLTAVVGGVLLVGAGGLASWHAPASVSPTGSSSTGTGGPTLVDANGTSMADGVSDLLPGDWFYRYLDVVDDDAAAGGFTGSVTATGDLAGQLGVDVVACTVPWQTVNGASTCAGVTSGLGSGTPTATTPVIVDHGEIGAGVAAAQHVRYQFTLLGAGPSSPGGGTGSVGISVGSTTIGSATG